MFRYLTALLFPVVALLVVACGDSGPGPSGSLSSGADSTPTSHVPTVTPDVSPDEPPVAAEESEEPQILTTIVHATVPDVDHWGKATASIEERTYLADVVVKARLISAADDVLRFRSIEYLKGTGVAEFTVRATTAGRDTQWDNQDAILFLDELTGQTEDFEFIDTATWVYLEESTFTAYEYTGNLSEGYTIGTRNPVWLPVNPLPQASPSSGGVSGASSNPADDRTFKDVGVTGGFVDLSESSLAAVIDWMAGPPALASAPPVGRQSSPSTTTASSADITISPEEYQHCIRASLGFIRNERDIEAHIGQPRPNTVWDYNLNSGAPAGIELLTWENTKMDLLPKSLHKGYDRHWVDGPDADLLVVTMTDPDNVASTGYTYRVTTARPLPAGSYTAHYEIYRWAAQRCNFHTEDTYAVMSIEVTAPKGTAHEAFFDPATTTDGVGYSTSTGVLEPAAFDGGVITTLTWRNGKVRTVTNPAGALASTTLDFIALDGSTALSLDPEVATSTGAALAWDVSPAPWKAGDRLMLRVTSDLPPPIFDAQLTAGSLSSVSEPGYLQGFTGELTPGEFEFNGSTIPVAAFYWTNGGMKFLTQRPADLAGYVITVLDSEGAELLKLAFDDARVLVRGSNFTWDVSEQPFNKGDTVRMTIRPAE